MIKTRHFALPPALRNSLSGVSNTIKPRDSSPSQTFGQPSFITIESPGSNVIAGEPGVSAFQEISFAFKIHFRGQPGHIESPITEPLLEMSSFTSPNFIAKIAYDKLVVPDQAAVRGEDRIWEPWLRFN